MIVSIRDAVPVDRDAIAEIIRARWESTLVVSRGVVHDTADLPALIADAGGQIAGLLTYRLDDESAEVVTVDALEPGQGVGTALLRAIAERGRRAGWRRLWLITTNDNTAALRFYQREGWDIVALHRNAIDEARQIKPEIPTLGADHIPIRHEIELEYALHANTASD